MEFLFELLEVLHMQFMPVVFQQWPVRPVDEPMDWQRGIIRVRRQHILCRAHGRRREVGIFRIVEMIARHNVHNLFGLFLHTDDVRCDTLWIGQLMELLGFCDIQQTNSKQFIELWGRKADFT